MALTTASLTNQSFAIDTPTFNNVAITTGVAAIVAQLQTYNAPGQMVGQAEEAARMFAKVVRLLQMLGA
jgi:hypothetical protein